MEVLIAECSNRELRAVFHELWQIHFVHQVADDLNVRIKKSQVNYHHSKKLLLAYASSSRTNERIVATIIQNIRTESESQKVVALDPVTGLVVVSGMILVHDLISKSIQQEYALGQREEFIQKIIAKPTEANINAINQIYTQLNKMKAIKDDARTIDILILTPVETEYQMVRKFLENIEKVKHRLTKSFYEVGSFGHYKVAIRLAKQTNPQMAVEAERAIHYFDPQVVFLVGIAGGRNPNKVKIGDVLVVDRVYSYETGIENQEEHQSREKGGPLNHELIELAIMESRNHDWLQFTAHRDDQFKVIVGAVASGEKIIGNSQSVTAKLIERHSQDSIAVEMEGWGLETVLRAYPQIKGLVIRSISDMLDDKEKKYKGGGRELAAENASAFTFHLIQALDIEPKSVVESDTSNKTTPRTGPEAMPGGTFNFHTAGDNNIIQQNNGIINIGVKKNSQRD